MSSNVPSKALCETAHGLILNYMMKDFESNFMKAKENKNFTYFIQSSVHSTCKDLKLEKQVVIYLLHGMNRFRSDWGNLEDVHKLEPLKNVIRREVVSKGKSLVDDCDFRVWFVDSHKNGDFKMKVEFGKFDTELKQTTTTSEGPWLQQKRKNPVKKVATKSRDGNEMNDLRKKVSMLERIIETMKSS